MKVADKEYIINTVFRTNILPVISECNTSCIFCSHKQNPKDIEVFRMPKLGMEDFGEIINFLSADRKIIVGESATRIIEGEPLLHKDFLDIVASVRDRYPRTPIQITTNGTLLQEALVESLVRLGMIELNISVNSVNPMKRERILGLKREDGIAGKLCLLKDRLKFTGSFVWVPEILTASDVEEIVAVLQENGANAVRMFLPGYTSLSRITVQMEELFKEASQIVKELRGRYHIPVIIEPSLIEDLESRVEGVMPNTPAWDAGMKAGDIIRQVNGKSVLTRVEAFESSFKRANPVLKLSREEKEITIKLEKQRNSPPGFVLPYDIHPEFVEEINSAVRRHDAKNVLLMTSELAVNTIKGLFAVKPPEVHCRVISIKNSYFGGNIQCAGLLTVEDVVLAGKEFLADGERPDLLLLPHIMFDFKKKDLLGKSIKEVEENLKIPVDTL